jgi:hypothetical protein
VALVASRVHKDPISAAFSIARNRASKIRLLLEDGHRLETTALEYADSLLADVYDFIDKQRRWKRPMESHQEALLRNIAWEAREDADPEWSRDKPMRPLVDMFDWDEARRTRPNSK